jgi:hypothetical protein
MKIVRKASNPGRSAVTASLLIGGFGLILCAISLVKGGLDLLYHLDGAEIRGTILYSDYAYGPQHMPHRNVVYQFTPPRGTTLRGSQSGYSGKPGESILIQYLSSRPSINRVAGAQVQEDKWLLIPGGVGLLFIGIALHTLVINARRQGE